MSSRRRVVMVESVTVSCGCSLPGAVIRRRDSAPRSLSYHRIVPQQQQPVPSVQTTLNFPREKRSEPPDPDTLVPARVGAHQSATTTAVSKSPDSSSASARNENAVGDPAASKSCVDSAAAVSADVTAAPMIAPCGIVAPPGVLMVSHVAVPFVPKPALHRNRAQLSHVDIPEVPEFACVARAWGNTRDELVTPSKRHLCQRQRSGAHSDVLTSGKLPQCSVLSRSDISEESLSHSNLSECEHDCGSKRRRVASAISSQTCHDASAHQLPSDIGTKPTCEPIPPIRSSQPSRENDVVDAPQKKNTSYAVPITEADEARLKPEQLLNDSLIEFYLLYWQSSPQYRDIHFFNTFFFKKLQLRNDTDKSLRKWTKHVQLYEKKFLIIPVNHTNHWCVTIACMPNSGFEESPCLVLLDSCRDLYEPYHNNIGRLITGYLENDWKVSHPEATPPKFSLYVPHVPQQNNGSDCGVYMLLFLDHFLREAPLSVRAFDLWDFPLQAAETCRTKLGELVKQHKDAAEQDKKPAMSNQEEPGSDVEAQCEIVDVKHPSIPLDCDSLVPDDCCFVKEVHYDRTAYEATTAPGDVITLDSEGEGNQSEAETNYDSIDDSAEDSSSPKSDESSTEEAPTKATIFTQECDKDLL
ncbi:Peptidase C48 [Pelomyxa schiedti]|nr:Peptidase C48 [Pelomyxa schiedti]